jgi:hypothetical protein
VLRMVHASSTLQLLAPAAHDAAQYESLAICTQYPPAQSVSLRQALHATPLPPSDELPLLPGLPLLLWPVLVLPPSSPLNTVSSVVDVPAQPAMAAHAARHETKAPGARNRDVYDMIDSAGKSPGSASSRTWSECPPRYETAKLRLMPSRRKRGPP